MGDKKQTDLLVKQLQTKLESIESENTRLSTESTDKDGKLKNLESRIELLDQTKRSLEVVVTDNKNAYAAVQEENKRIQTAHAMLKTKAEQLKEDNINFDK